MGSLKKELIKLGCPESHTDNFIAEVIKHDVSENFESSILTMVKGLKADSSTAEEFELQMDKVKTQLMSQGANTPQLLLELIAMSLDFGSLHQRNIKLINELDLKQKEKDTWRQLAEERGISLFKLITSVCISDVFSKLPEQLSAHFKKSLGTQAEWGTIYTKLNLEMAILTFDVFQTGVSNNSVAVDTFTLLNVLDSFCKSKGIPLQKSMLLGLKIKKEINIEMVHVKFTGQETNARDVIMACHIFGDYSSLLNNEQTTLINELWDIAKALLVYNK